MIMISSSSIRNSARYACGIIFPLENRNIIGDGSPRIAYQKVVDL